MKTQRYDIVLLPNQEIRQKVTTLSEQFVGPDTYFTLKDGSIFPHLSLYMVDLQTETVEMVSQELATIAASRSPLQLHAIGYRQHHGFIGVEYEKTDSLVALQEAILTRISPLRDPEDDSQRINEAAPGIARENTINYGYMSVGELFEPHITITRFKDATGIATDHLPSVDEFLATFGTLAIFEMGEHGTCVRKVMEYTLKS